MMPPSSAKDMLMQVKRYADGGDVSSAGLAKAISSGLTQEQYDNNIRAYIAKTSNPLDALNAATENGVSMADINRALGTKAASDYFTTDYNTETAPSTNVATGFTSQIAEKYNAPGGQGLTALNKRIGEIGAQYGENTPESAAALRDIFIQERGSIADLQRAGFDPSRLLGTVAKKAPPKPQPPTGGGVSTGYQPLPEPPPIYAPGQQALNVPFRDSPVRTYDPRYGYTYTPAAQLLSATGSGMSWTPPSVTGRPRELLNVPLPTAENPRLSSSQAYARDLKAKQELDALNMAGGRFSGQQAPTPIFGEMENPNAVKPIDLRFYAPPPVGMQSGGPIKKPEGTADDSDRAPVDSSKTADQYADVFGEMDNIDKLSSLLKGGYLGAKYLLSSPNQYLEHGRYPDVIREKLQQEYRDLGTERIDAGPLDAALNYAGAYDWAVRPDVDPEDARKMAEAYQLRYYIDPNRVPQNEVADYYRNMAGVEAGVRDRALNKRLSDVELMAEAVAYAADQTGTPVPRTRSQTYADMFRETPPEAKGRDVNSVNTPKESYLPGFQTGGYVTQKQEGGPVSTPMSNAELLAQIDRSTAATPNAVTPDRDPVKSESAGMLSRLNDAFGRNISQPIVGSAIDMTAGMGDILQRGTKYLANRAGVETKPFTPVAPAIQEAAGTAGYDPYSPAALAASVLLPAAAPLRTAAAATRPMMSMAAAPGSAKQTLSLIKPILDREASVAASAELAAMGARKLAPDNVTAEIAAAIAGGAGYNTLDNILSGASRGPMTSGMAAKEKGGVFRPLTSESNPAQRSNLGELLDKYDSAFMQNNVPEDVSQSIVEKARRYFTTSFGTTDDPLRMAILEGNLNPIPLKADGFSTDFRDYLVNAAKESYKQQKNRVAAGDNDASSEVSSALEDFVKEYDKKTRLQGNIYTRGGLPYDQSQAMQASVKDRLITQGVPPKLVNANVNLVDLDKLGYIPTSRMPFIQDLQTGNDKTLAMALQNNEPIYDLENGYVSLPFLKPEQLAEAAQEIPLDTLRKMSFPELVIKSSEITNRDAGLKDAIDKAKQNKKVLPKYFLNEGVRPLIDANANQRWYQITNSKYTELEGNTMGHSVGGYSRVGIYNLGGKNAFDSGVAQLYSLRNTKTGIPATTIEIENANPVPIGKTDNPKVKQIKGFQNGLPPSKDAVFKLIKELSISPENVPIAERYTKDINGNPLDSPVIISWRNEYMEYLDQISNARNYAQGGYVTKKTKGA